MKIYNSAIDLIGNTPLVELGNIERELSLTSKIFAKVEYFNPCGSVKDRASLYMIPIRGRREPKCAAIQLLELRPIVEYAHNLA